MNVGINDKIRPLRALIDDFKFAFTGSVQSVSLFFG